MPMLTRPVVNRSHGSPDPARGAEGQERKADPCARREMMRARAPGDLVPETGQQALAVLQLIGHTQARDPDQELGERIAEQGCTRAPRIERTRDPSTEPASEP